MGSIKYLKVGQGLILKIGTLSAAPFLSLLRTMKRNQVETAWLTEKTSRASVTAPVTAAAATISGLINMVRPVGEP